MKAAYRWVASMQSIVPSDNGGEQDSERQEKKKEVRMIEAIIIILIVLWALGFFAFHIGGGLIHALLVIAVIVLIIRLVQGKKIL